MTLITLYGLPGFVMEAANVAIREGSEEVARARETYRRRRDLVLEILAQAPKPSYARTRSRHVPYGRCEGPQ